MELYDPEAYRIGIEFEYQLQTIVDGRPRYCNELDFETLKEVVARSSSRSRDYMAIKYPGSDRRSIYLEGYDVVDVAGNVVEIDVKGVEIATPIATEVGQAEQLLAQQYTEMQDLLSEVGLRGVPYGGHAEKHEYRGPRGGRTVEGWSSVETGMTTWGIHVNISLPDSIEATLDRERLMASFTYFAPALVLLSANTPVRASAVWPRVERPGKSERSWRRSFVSRPLRFHDDQHYRKEVTCFDVTNRLDLISGYASVVLGLMLECGDVEPLPSEFGAHNIRKVSLDGYEAKLIDRHFEPIRPSELVQEALDRASEGLRTHAFDEKHLGALYEMASQYRCPADDTLKLWEASASWPDFLSAQSDLRRQ